MKLKVIKLAPGKTPELIDVDSHLHALEEQVEGPLEMLCIICNQDNLFPPPNGPIDIASHPILLCGVDGDTGIEDIPLSVIPESILRIFKEAANERHE